MTVLGEVLGELDTLDGEVLGAVQAAVSNASLESTRAVLLGLSRFWRRYSSEWT